jgi:hypothetical protein
MKELPDGKGFGRVYTFKYWQGYKYGDGEEYMYDMYGNGYRFGNESGDGYYDGDGDDEYPYDLL